jgi:hypothetical protein
MGYDALSSILWQASSAISFISRGLSFAPHVHASLMTITLILLRGLFDDLHIAELLCGVVDDPHVVELLCGLVDDPHVAELLRGLLVDPHVAELLCGPVNYSHIAETYHGLVNYPCIIVHVIGTFKTPQVHLFSIKLACLLLFVLLLVRL